VHLTRQVIDILGAIGCAALAVLVLFSWYALRRTIRKMKKLS